MTTFPDCSPRHGLVELGRDSGRRAGHFRGTCEPPHDVGCDGNSGGLLKARGLAIGRTRALHGTPVDEEESEVPSAARSPTMGRSVSLPGWWYEMACNLVMEMRYNTKTPHQKSNISWRSAPKGLCCLESIATSVSLECGTKTWLEKQ